MLAVFVREPVVGPSGSSGYKNSNIIVLVAWY